MKQPRRPARLSRAILAYAAKDRTGQVDYGDGKTVTLDLLAGSMDFSRAILLAMVNKMVVEGYLRRVIRGRGGLHHWRKAIYEITDEGRARLELLNQDKRIGDYPMTTCNRQFPVLRAGVKYPGVPTSVPWSLLEPHGRMAELNHSQTLEKLASRGGLSPDEIVSIVKDVRYEEYWRGFTKEKKIEESAKQLNALLAAIMG
jgi:DNA-binding PadR family transcriptional regulator